MDEWRVGLCIFTADSYIFRINALCLTLTNLTGTYTLAI